MKNKLAFGTACALLVAPVYALDFSFTGNLRGDDDVQLFSFTVGAPSNVILRTWSYAGGVNAADDLISRGGFDPILALFDNTGALIGQNDDGGPGLVDPDAVTGMYFDTFLDVALGAGDYTVSVMQFSNFALGPNLSDGFAGSGRINFEDVTGDFRTSAWAFDILNVGDAVVGPRVPDGGSGIILLGLGVGAIWLRKKTGK